MQTAGENRAMTTGKKIAVICIVTVVFAVICYRVIPASILIILGTLFSFFWLSDFFRRHKLRRWFACGTFFFTNVRSMNLDMVDFRREQVEETGSRRRCNKEILRHWTRAKSRHRSF
jgi:hypothetical protein